MVDGVHLTQQARDKVPVADVTVIEVDVRAEIAGPPVPVDRRRQRVEHQDPVPEREQSVARVRADEAGTAGDQYLHADAGLPMVGGLAVDIQSRRRGCRPRELARPPDSGVRQAVPVLADSTDDGLGDGLRLRGVAQERCSARSLRHGAGVRGNHRAAAGHRLQDRQPERLVERRVNEHVRSSIEAHGGLQRYPAREDDIGGDPQFSC